MIRCVALSSFALSLAAVGLLACGGGTTTPAADGGAATIDGGPAADGGSALDGGSDAGVSIDGGRTDGGTDGGRTDGGTGPQCNQVAVENLNMLGTVSGQTVRFTGNNTSTSASLTVGIQVPAALQTDGSDPGLCAFRIGHQRVFSYVATTTSTLVVSTSNPGTDIFMDTVVYVIDAPTSPATPAGCSRSPTVTPFLACDDDDAAFSGEQRRISSTAATFRQVQAGQRVYIAVGGYVSPTASASRDQTRELGNFELSVQELPATADGMPCDARGVTSACSDASWCVRPSVFATSGTCRPRGSVAGAACDRTSNPATCVSPLTCDTDVGICVATVADGMPCNAFSRCGATSTCAGEGERGFVSGTCLANGTAALTACNASGGCSSGLTCREGVCLISATTACSVWDTSCPQNTTTPAMNQDCVASSPTGTAGTCTQTATVAGTSCESTCSSSGVTCDTEAGVCSTTRAVGQACGPRDACASGSRCFLEDLNDRYNGKCFADGAVGGACRTAGTACTSPAVCSNPSDPGNGRCVTQVADGAECSLTVRCSNATSSCVPDATMRTGAFRGTCRAAGTVAGAECRPSTTPACDNDLSCSTFLPESGICQTIASQGGACDPRFGSIRCPTGQVCRSTSIHLAGTCVAPTAEPAASQNDTPWSLSSPPAALTLPMAIQGTLDLGDRDCQRVSVPQNGKLYAGLTSTNGVCPDFDVRIDVYRYDTTLRRVRLVGTDSGSGLGSCPRIEGGAANGNFAWAVNTEATAADWYVCLQSAADDRGPVNGYVLSLAIN